MKVYCADVIARVGDKIVVVERLGSVPGLALPGGKREQPGEWLSAAGFREVLEETGLVFALEGVLDIRDEPGRDPRGDYVSVVLVGRADGVLCDEPGKTRGMLLDEAEFRVLRDKFVFDHAAIVEKYFASR